MTGHRIVAGEGHGEQVSKRMLSRMSSLETDIAELQLRVSLLEERCDELTPAGESNSAAQGGSHDSSG